MTPKSLLRDKRAGSDLRDLADLHFASVIDDVEIARRKVRKVVLCSGKVYYDLLEARGPAADADVALVRVELLNPWPAAAIAAVLAHYPQKEGVWCQEEPRNMGAWVHARLHFEGALGYAGRPASASPATGSLHTHKREQAEVVRTALG